jgi:hypothetical protein
MLIEQILSASRNVVNRSTVDMKQAKFHNINCSVFLMMLKIQNMLAGNGRNQKTRRLTFAIFLLFLLGTLVTAFHYHHDIDGDHHDCSVCAAAHLISSASVNSFSLTIHQPVSDYEVPKEPLLYDGVRLTFLTSRSPPA